MSFTLTAKQDSLATDVLTIINDVSNDPNSVDFETDDGPDSARKHYALTVSPLLDWDQEENFRRKSGLSHEDFIRELINAIETEESCLTYFPWLYRNHDSKQLNFLSPHKTTGENIGTPTREIFCRFAKKMERKHKLTAGTDYEVVYIITIVKDYGRISELYQK